MKNWLGLDGKYEDTQGNFVSEEATAGRVLLYSLAMCVALLVAMVALWTL